MKKRLIFICVLSYMMPVLLGITGKLAGCRMKYILYLLVMGFYLLFWECLFLIAYSRRKKVNSTALMVLCCLGMLPFGGYLCLFLISAIL